MDTFHITATVEREGVLELRQLPFHAGQRVAVVIQAVASDVQAAPGSLRGSVLHYDDPTAPVAADDWEAGE